MTNKITVPSELIHRAIDAIEQVGYQDKFIDYTFVRAVKQELRDALDEPTRGIDHETMRARYADPEALDLSSGTGSTLRVAVADPVPPAGGEPEGYKYRLKGRVNRAWTYAKDKPEQFTDEFDVVPLYSGDIVTRLQAEVDHWKRLWGKAISAGAGLEEERDALQAKLTKARELLSTHCPNISIGVREFLSNQSAPADKGQVNPEHTLFNEIRISEPVNEDGEPTRYLITEAQLQRIRALEADKGQGEPVAWIAESSEPAFYLSGSESTASAVAEHYREKGFEASVAPLYRRPTVQPAPVAVVLPEKYDDVLLPFLSLMRAELHANAHKGDRPGWLQMDRKTAVLEVFYHMGKLHQAVHRDEAEAIKEYAADVANMCMMLTDVCGCLDSEPKP